MGFGVFSEEILRKSAHNARIKLVLRDLDAGVECLRGIVRENRNAALAEDFPRIDPLVDKVHRATRLWDSGFHGLTPCLEPPKLREE